MAKELVGPMAQNVLRLVLTKYREDCFYMIHNNKELISTYQRSHTRPCGFFFCDIMRSMQNLDKQFPFVSKIPAGSHGSTKFQKKYWKVVSDTVRIRDWYKYKRCISCNRYAVDWKYLQAGHFKAWSTCKGYSKWDMKNIFGQCGICNTGFNGMEVGAKFRDGIVDRYGQERMDYIDLLQKYPGEKMDDFKCCLMIKEILKEMKDLPEQPDYYTKCQEWL